MFGRARDAICGEVMVAVVDLVLEYVVMLMLIRADVDMMACDVWPFRTLRLKQ